MRTVALSGRVVFLLLLAVCGCSPASGPRTPTWKKPAQPITLDLGAFTGGLPACLLVTDATGRIVTRAGGERCAQRFSPCSTFKIPNSLIGLETGVLTDATTVIPWDRDRYPRQGCCRRSGQSASTIFARRLRARSYPTTGRWPCASAARRWNAT